MPARSVLRWIAALSVAAVVGAACTTSSSKSSSSTPTTGSGNQARTASAKGVTADTIKLGFSYPDLEALRKSGVLKADNGPYEPIIKAIVDDVNEHGGVNGRKIVPSVVKFSVLGNDAQLAACSQLTEDDKVFAVLGGFIGDNNLCVTQQHSTPLISGYGSGYNQIALGKARAPWATWNASDERSVKALVQLLNQQGRLTGRKIGIYGQGAASKPLIDLTASALEGVGHKATDTAINDVPPDDTQAFTAQDRVIGNKFKDEGITTVIVLVTVPPGKNFDDVGYHPEMYSPQTSLISPGAVSNPYDKFPIVAGLAAAADPDTGFDTPAMQECRAAYKRETGKDIKPPSQEPPGTPSSGFPAMAEICSAMQIFVAAAKAAGTNLTPDTWKTGLESIGKIVVPISPVSSFGPNKPDGQDSFQLMKQDPAWKFGATTPEFIPLGQPITLTN